MCVSLKNKQYCILNEQYTKEEYKQKVKKIFDNLDEYLEKYENLIIKTPKRLYH
jgi:predicted secreted protein